MTAHAAFLYVEGLPFPANSRIFAYIMHLCSASIPKLLFATFFSAVQLLLAGAQLPALHSSRHFINLTNGVEALPTLTALQLTYSFVRLPSTDCEQQNWEQLLLSLDANLLTMLALGHRCAGTGLRHCLIAFAAIQRGGEFLFKDCHIFCCNGSIYTDLMVCNQLMSQNLWRL